MAAEEQTNFMPRAFGPMSLRPGLQYIGETVTGPVPAGTSATDWFAPGGPGSPEGTPGSGTDTDPQPPPPPDFLVDGPHCFAPYNGSLDWLFVSGLLPLFDSDLGTLTGAELTINLSFGTEITLSLDCDTDPNPVCPSSGPMSGEEIIYFDFDALEAGLSEILIDLGYVQLSGSTSTTISCGVPFSSGQLTDQTSVTIDLASILGALSAPGGGTTEVYCNAHAALTVGTVPPIDPQRPGPCGTGSSTPSAEWYSCITYTYIPN
jgi:hypothetical protein